MITVSVKWQKETFPAVEIDISQPPSLFKAQLYDITGVPPHRQKIMVKGGIIKDDSDWSTLGIKQGQKLMMMGTVNEVTVPETVPETERRPDSPEYHSDSEEHKGEFCSGLFNLGNTCYMNSTIQSLHSVPELKSALMRYPHPGRNSELDQTSHLLTCATRDLFNELHKDFRPVAPMQFWTILRKKFPQFGQLDNGSFMQQDAEECWTQILYTLSQSLKSHDISENPDIIKALFGIKLVSRLYCEESGEESFESESVFALKCHISKDVNHLSQGLKQSLQSDIEKISPSLGRSATYLKESHIHELPKYLTIQFVRFFWKRESNRKAKILRKVEFPLALDVHDFCSEDVRKDLERPRKMLESLRNILSGVENNKESKLQSEEKGVEAEEGKDTGFYELIAVLTHKGRSADSGHYVAWAKQPTGGWMQFDDDKREMISEEEIPKLCGGGDWHMAYICVYKAVVVHFPGEDIGPEAHSNLS